MPAPPDSPILGFDAFLDPTAGGPVPAASIDLVELIRQAEALQHNAQVAADAEVEAGMGIGGPGGVVGMGPRAVAAGTNLNPAVGQGGGQTGLGLTAGAAASAARGGGGRWDVGPRGGLT